MDEITVPVGSSQIKAASSYSNTMLAGILSKIKSQISEHTFTIMNQKSPEELINEFDFKLKENAEKIVVLSEKALNAIMKFLAKNNDEQLKSKFYSCCNQSLDRSNKFAPKDRGEIDALLEEALESVESTVNCVDEEQQTIETENMWSASYH